MQRSKLPFRGSFESSGHYSVSTVIYIPLCFHPFQLVFFLLFQGNKASFWSYSKNTFVCKRFPKFRQELRTRARLTTVNIHIHDLRMSEAEKSSGNTPDRIRSHYSKKTMETVRSTSLTERVQLGVTNAIHFWRLAWLSNQIESASAMATALLRAVSIYDRITMELRSL